MRQICSKSAFFKHSNPNAKEAQHNENIDLKEDSYFSRISHVILERSLDITALRDNAHNTFHKAVADSSSLLKKFWALSDLRTMLQPKANDAEFIAILRGIDSEDPASWTFEKCKQQLQELTLLIDKIPQLSNSVRKEIAESISDIHKALSPLEHGTPAFGRVIKGFANLLNLWPLLVPSPLLANQAKTFAYTVASSAKGTLSVLGSTFRATADGLPFPLMGGELGRQANEVHFYPALLNIIFLSSELAKRYGSTQSRLYAEQITDSAAFHISAAVCCGMTLITPFIWDSIRHYTRQKSNAIMRLGMHSLRRSSQTKLADLLQQRLKPVQIDASFRNQLSDILIKLDEGRIALQKARLDFTAPSSNRELTRTLNAQCTHILEKIRFCAQNLSETFDQESALIKDTTLDPARSFGSNPDFAAKLSLMLLAAGISGSTVFLIQPDKIGTVDLSADSAVVTAVMAQAAWNSQATKQESMERFKSMASVSLVMALALSIDKISKAFTPRGLIASTSAAPYYSAAAMTLMAMTLPGPVAQGAETFIQWTGSKIKNILPNTDSEMEFATCAPSTLEELQAHTKTLSNFIGQLDPEQQHAYEAHVCENIRQTFSVENLSNPFSLSHSVVITEIDEDNELSPSADFISSSGALLNQPSHVRSKSI